MAKHRFSVAETLKGSLASVKSRRGYAKLIKDLAKMDFQKMLGEKGLALLKEMTSRPEFVPAMLGAAYGVMLATRTSLDLDNIAYQALSGALGATLIVQESQAAQILGTTVLGAMIINAGVRDINEKLGTVSEEIKEGIERATKAAISEYQSDYAKLNQAKTDEEIRQAYLQLKIKYGDLP